MCTLSDLFAQDGLAITNINVGQEKIIVHAQSSAAEAPCPSCHVKSNRVHSRYARSINDLPILGRQLQIQLNARKLSCENEKCPQRIFCERFSTFTDSHAQSTKRLNLALCKISLAAGAEGGARLTQVLSIPTSGDTVLRRLHTAPLPQMPPPHVIGVDDWAYKKGLTYGIC